MARWRNDCEKKSNKSLQTAVEISNKLNLSCYALGQERKSYQNLPVFRSFDPRFKKKIKPQGFRHFTCNI